MGVLVTGGAGFIGSHMALELLGAGEDVLVIDNLSTGFRWAVPAEAKFVEGDVGDHNLVRRLLLRNPIDAIIHFAGSIVVPESIADPLGYYLNNTCKSRSLIAVAVETKSRISSSPRPPRSTACRRRTPSARRPGSSRSRRTAAPN
jgi:UDP-glucose 4-epimerase